MRPAVAPVPVWVLPDDTAKVDPKIWHTACDTRAVARDLYALEDRSQMLILLQETDRWFADRLAPVSRVVKLAAEITAFAEWAGLDYRLLEMLEMQAGADGT